MKRIKVLVMDMLCMSAYHDRYLCQALQEIGVDVTLASISFHLDTGYFRRHHLKNDPGLLDIVAKMGVKSSPLRQLLKLVELYVNLLTFGIRFLFSRPDIIHVQWLPLVTHTNVELWLLRFARRLGIRLVYSVHNVLPHDTGDRFKPAFQAVYDKMDALICHTDESRGRLTSEFGQDPGRLVVIPLAPQFQDESRITCQDARKLLALETREIIVLFSGSVAPYKGLDFLLEGWRAAKGSFRVQARLIIAGPATAPMKRALKERIRLLSLQDSVKLDLRFIPTELLPAYFQAADVLVYPYSEITQSGAVMTGISFGKPIIATRLPAFAEILKDEESALLVSHGDVKALVSALTRLVGDSQERTRLGIGAASRLQTMHSWRDAATQCVGVYRKVLQWEPLAAEPKPESYSIAKV